ncbi:MAG: hypothetical protein FJZ01_15425 [Candidatus Sericytochromatia bacterium]|nr:hypothetical protein [Candidatus Tanganyikabacteria bacterium]
MSETTLPPPAGTMPRLPADVETLRIAYAALAELWCSPRDAESPDLVATARAASEAVRRLDPDAAALLVRFLETPIDEDAYVELFELDPRCALYLGSHTFEEPRSCAKAGVSDRNGYMGELLGIYGHFGLSPNGRELPDYLPLLLEFLAFAVEKDDPIREKLLAEYILPYLPPVRNRLAELDTPYVLLMDALERILKLDLSLAKESIEEVAGA